MLFGFSSHPFAKYMGASSLNNIPINCFCGTVHLNELTPFKGSGRQTQHLLTLSFVFPGGCRSNCSFGPEESQTASSQEGYGTGGWHT